MRTFVVMVAIIVFAGVVYSGDKDFVLVPRYSGLGTAVTNLNWIGIYDVKQQIKYKDITEKYLFVKIPDYLYTNSVIEDKVHKDLIEDKVHKDLSKFIARSKMLSSNKMTDLNTTVGDTNFAFYTGNDVVVDFFGPHGL